MSLEVDAMRFDPAAYAVAQQRVKSAPLELTESDYAQLAIVSPALEREAIEAVRQAQLAIVRKSAQATKTPSHKPVTYAVLGKALEEVIKIVAKAIKPLQQSNKELCARVVPLEQSNKELEQSNKELAARVLELEAAAAARSKVDA
jgi:hypothetical protein